jgi:hypothetical protein
MITALILCSFYTVYAQQSSTSILTQFQTPQLTPYDIELQKKNLNAGNPSTDADTILVNTTESQEDSKLGIFDEISEVTNTNTQLYSQINSAQTSQQNLQNQLEDSQKKTNMYIQDYNSSLSDSIQKITTLDNYNHYLISSYKPAPKVSKIIQSNHTSSQSAGTDDKKQVYQTAIFGIGICILIIMILGLRLLFGNFIDPVFNKSLYSLFEGISILLIISGISCFVYYQDFFPDINYDYILLGLAIFTFTWLCLGILVILTSQGFVYRWNRYENNLFEVERQLRDYDESIKCSDNLIQYWIMRKLFICSRYLPSKFYIKSFDFSQYLARCLADNIKDLLEINWLGYCIIITVSGLWRVLIYMNLYIENTLVLIFPLCCMGINIIILLKLIHIYNQLVPDVNDNVIDSLNPDDLDTLPIPEYLRGRIPSIQSNPVLCLFIKIHPGKISFGYILKNSIPSRHDFLFWLDILGISFIKGILQGITVLLCLWLTVLCIYYIPSFDCSAYEVLIISGSILVWTIVQLGVLPYSIRYLCIVSSIEMKKNKNNIQEVLLSQKILRSQLMIRIYKQMKMIYRDKYIKNRNENPSDFLDTFTKEIFEIHTYQTLSVENIEDILSMCGIELNEDDLRLFAKECIPVFFI